MLKHLRASLSFVVLSMVVCCVLYPLTVLAIAKTFFPRQAEGSLLDEKGQLVTDPAKAVGSRLIGQPFAGDEYFQPRPSATTPSYNAAASGATNWGASNCQLRDRVARIIGPLAKYANGPKKGQLAGADVEAWFQKDLIGGKDKGIVAYWAKSYPTLAGNWVTSDPLITEFVAGWMRQHPEEVAKWKQANAGEPAPKDMAGAFFDSYVQTFPGTWPSIQDQPTPDGKTKKMVKPVTSGSDVQSYFFDLWLQENGDVDLEKVPADMVMASGSGLDPHITLKNGLFQLDRVAGKWAEKTKQDEAAVKIAVKALLTDKAETTVGGGIRVPIVNVLEVNIALKNLYGPQVVSGK